MLNLVFRVAITVLMNKFILGNILCLFLAHICLIYKHCVFGERTIFHGHLVSLFKTNPLKKDCSHLVSVDGNFSLSYLNERDIFPHKFEKCQNDSISRMEAMWHTGKFKLSIREKTSRKYLCC
jgi:hypothetical protein